MEKLPKNSKALIKELEKIYPDRMVVDNDTYTAFEMGKMAGVVDLLRMLNRIQEE
ncbi:hypothetical protein AV947_gp33 [Podophage Lau218]|uniref:Putative phage protein n=2 Tax=Lauvirus lau218 TaxID=1465639 RepID=A0A060BRR6_9CAUD|nr:hypothetical protein AV947_gp33 [Podophage Lau218]AIA83148.1 putative phage protein [Podophage Lau218]AIA83196.1 putative phage protein [Lauvirus lau218]AIA83246.1 putative phage protein [Lauvirus lau218]